MSKLTPPPKSHNIVAGQQDYDAIEAAVMETARGRWFLQEYARRNKNTDTNEVLSAVERLEHKITNIENPSLQGQPIQINPDEIRISLGEMQQAIDLTRHEIMSLIPPEGYSDPFTHSTGELDLVVNATEKATQIILSHAETVQEVAWLLREENIQVELCNKLDICATEIYTACSFQDLTGQRIRKVIQALQFIEDRVNSMIKVWVENDQPSHQTKHQHNTAPWLPNQQTLANGPAAPGTGLDQDDVDAVLSIKLNSRNIQFDQSTQTEFNKNISQDEVIELSWEDKPIIISTFDLDDDDLIFINQEFDQQIEKKSTTYNKDLHEETIKSLSIEEKLALFI